MDRSESIKEIAGALNKAQAEMSGAKKGKSNPFFKSKYADMNSVVDAVRIPFSNHGLSYSQFPLFREGLVGVETMLMHDSGEWISSELLLPLTKQDAQAAGSAITYARRYALQSIAGIPSEDDDGNSATASQVKVERDRIAAMNQAYKENKASVDFVKEALASGNFDGAAEAMQELSEDTRLALNVAPTKGGIWTLADTKAFQGEEYKASRTRYFEEKNK